MKSLLIVLATVLTANVSMACGKGGDIIQVVIVNSAGKKMVVAEFAKKNGERGYTNPNVEEINVTTTNGQTVCKNKSGSCSVISQMKSAQDLVVVAKLKSPIDQLVGKLMKKVMINVSVPLPKAAPPVPGQAKPAIVTDIAGKEIYTGCGS